MTTSSPYQRCFCDTLAWQCLHASTAALKPSQVPKEVLSEIAKRGSLAIVKSGSQIHESNPVRASATVTCLAASIAYSVSTDMKL